jgi:hypothetical protein
MQVLQIFKPSTQKSIAYLKIVESKFYQFVGVIFVRPHRFLLHTSCEKSTSLGQFREQIARKIVSQLSITSFGRDTNSRF